MKQLYHFGSQREDDESTKDHDFYMIGAGLNSFDRTAYQHRKLIKTPERPNREEIVAMKESERMAALQNMAQTGSWELAYDLDGEYIDDSLQWSNQVYRIYGYEPNEIKPSSKVFFKLVHPEDLDEVVGAMAESLVLKKSFSLGHRIISKSGAVKYVQQRGEFIFDKGKVISLIGITQDLTEKKIQLLELQSSQSKLKNILENSETAYILISEECKIISFNQRADQFSRLLFDLELSYDSLLYEMIGSFGKKNTKVALEWVLNTKNSIKHEVKFDLKNCEEIWMKIKVSPVFNKNEEILGLTIAIDDVTVEKQWMIEKEAMNRRLLQRNKSLEQFAYIISHNLRAPLANILGLSQLISELSPQDEIFKSTLDGLQQSSCNLDQVVSDLNTILKMRDNNEGETVIDLRQIVEEAFRSFNLSSTQTSIEIELQFDQAQKVRGIKAYLLSIFINLIGNSIKYSRTGVSPKISIKSSINKGSVFLEFQDNGIGIDLKQHGENVFKLYKRFHTHVEGRGMGLYMVYSQVLALGGEIKVDSIVDEGTCFTIQLPE
ncbi:sensor histidine kinase [Algoriphagus pacificus]|uniref:histidine kinase n=1 Tax=Algoriphagus pacificus TaxID=2811234 RepID=A0ABS3CKS2_9BACT|nr:PAS domain-containing sensor histidine kinase [Algoriphagus pacificus]MBN7817698.1 PAS domain-containing protein [Algoriphagus pacificus]